MSPAEAVAQARELRPGADREALVTLALYLTGAELTVELIEEVRGLVGRWGAADPGAATV